MKKLSLATILLLSTASLVVSAENLPANTEQAATVEQKAQIVPEAKVEKAHKKHHHKHKKEHKKCGGFVDPNNPQQQTNGKKPFANNLPVSQISEQATWKDDQRIVLQGNIIKQLSKDDFLFRDKSGEIEVEIEPHAWRGKTITPSDEVKILAEVDKSDKKLELEVQRVAKVAKSH
ncbi:NirD/YgiW/YdeI family stress tolerance protein [Avibacterium sp. 21-586]|uniref:YgiW/YdeI family stress tolerance OB fold protein n=1 Tax=Avibacterium sp. 21-586 TaxID=2911534 RepID=UPI002246D1A4|nr:NirD/YgiW/YdeI family stress tolerance protein [Avibacterium sp. 21-586]MCW9710577.1 NirD/YgiW/YdeI family stress tolerance protein [Avibacterium sp. 21-586]